MAQLDAETPATPVSAGPRRELSQLGRSPQGGKALTDTACSSGRSAPQTLSKGGSSKTRSRQSSGGDQRDRRSLLARMHDEDRAQYDDWAGYDDEADASSWSSRGSKGKRSGTKTIKLRSPSAMGTSPGSAPGSYSHRCVQTIGRDATSARRSFSAGAGDGGDEDLELAIALSQSLADIGGGGGEAASASGSGGGGGGGGSSGGDPRAGFGEGRGFPFSVDDEETFPASTSAPIAAAAGGAHSLGHGRPPLPGQHAPQRAAGGGGGGVGGGGARHRGSPGPTGAWVAAPRIPRSREGDMSYEALVELEDVRATAPPEVVDALPTRIAGDGDEDTAESLCPICQEQFAAGDAILALRNCKHLLHRECGREWLLCYSKRCPTCKASVVPAGD